MPIGQRIQTTHRRPPLNKHINKAGKRSSLIAYLRMHCPKLSLTGNRPLLALFYQLVKNQVITIYRMRF
ncbi:MAG: hypothetical protein ACJAXK_002711 [Yoonia sp.]|jgi:hypothetical protein